MVVAGAERKEAATPAVVEELQGLVEVLGQNLKGAQDSIQEIARLPVGMGIEKMEVLTKLYRAIDTGLATFEKAQLQIQLPLQERDDNHR